MVTQGNIFSALPKLAAGGDRLLTVPEILSIAPELGTDKNPSKVLASRGVIQTRDHELRHWGNRKFFIRTKEHPPEWYSGMHGTGERSTD